MRADAIASLHVRFRRIAAPAKAFREQDCTIQASGKPKTIFLTTGSQNLGRMFPGSHVSDRKLHILPPGAQSGDDRYGVL